MRAAIFVATLALVASTGLASRSLLAPAPAPSSCQTVAQVAQANGLTTLLAAVQAADLTSALSDPNLAYTVFAPTNTAFSDAFAALNVTADQVLGEKDVLTAILENHLLGYPLAASELLAKGTVETQYNFPNSNLTISQAGSDVRVASPVETATVQVANVPACKSIVHVISAVLIPAL